MRRFRKKPVVIEAVQLTHHSLNAVERFVGGDLGLDSSGGVVIATLEGAMHASIGDWIIRGVKGEFYPCKPDIFEAKYDAADDDSKPASTPAQPEHDAEVIVDRLFTPCVSCASRDDFCRGCDARRGQIRQAVQAGRALGRAEKVDALRDDAWEAGRKEALAECGTCGCTGVMEVDASGGAGPMTEEVCGECNGTGIGAMGQALRDAKAEGYREGKAHWERYSSINAIFDCYQEPGPVGCYEPDESPRDGHKEQPDVDVPEVVWLPRDGGEDGS